VKEWWKIYFTCLNWHLLSWSIMLHFLCFLVVHNKTKLLLVFVEKKIIFGFKLIWHLKNVLKVSWCFKYLTKYILMMFNQSFSYESIKFKSLKSNFWVWHYFITQVILGSLKEFLEYILTFQGIPAEKKPYFEQFWILKSSFVKCRILSQNMTQKVRFPGAIFKYTKKYDFNIQHLTQHC